MFPAFRSGSSPTAGAAERKLSVPVMTVAPLLEATIPTVSRVRRPPLVKETIPGAPRGDTHNVAITSEAATAASLTWLASFSTKTMTLPRDECHAMTEPRKPSLGELGQVHKTLRHVAAESLKVGGRFRVLPGQRVASGPQVYRPSLRSQSGVSGHQMLFKPRFESWQKPPRISGYGLALDRGPKRSHRQPKFRQLRFGPASGFDTSKLTALGLGHDSL